MSLCVLGHGYMKIEAVDCCVGERAACRSWSFGYASMPKAACLGIFCPEGEGKSACLHSFRMPKPLFCSQKSLTLLIH